MRPVPRIFFILIILILPSLSWAHDVTSADQEILNNGDLWAYIYVGATHMLTGYDHLLFLAGVIFFLKDFWDILKFITAFTLGHCITLIAATYLGFSVNEYFIDAFIALSVFYKGFENLKGFKRIFKSKAPNLLFMVFGFGLIHGLGLSARLQSFEMGQDQFLLKILSFNLGVELGQVLALIPIIFLIRFWQKFNSYKAFYKAANVYLMLAGVALFIWQVYLAISS
ncbi:hypothetical protein BST97_05695 [Nonlabens spongiae]|uniref:HupE / UreJ protein n=1 Tax=Nonlabens spongiae TaxID=331648 RepID=A0A1W6MIY0_9FLAO|nr:HupE/UreJ family protein [Nonlabens spongiae]ARN77517.1 hypothetical protein BST97_05695 [Nonlabens spongiae]